jgi:hypothetical protein
MPALSSPITIDKRNLLSLLWLFAMLNFIYCDLIALHDREVLAQLLDGKAGAMQITPLFLLLASLLMEIPILMVLLSRLLPHLANRIANIVAGGVMIVVQTASLFAGEPAMYYVLFSTIEIATIAGIVVLAARWRNLQSATPAPR